MKLIKNLLILILSIGLNQAWAQVDRSQKPASGPAPEIRIGKSQNFELDNGLKVIVVENRKLPRVAFNLILDRDPLLEHDKVGYISMAGQMLRRGTTNRSKDEIDQEVDFIGATLAPSASSIYAASLTKHKDKLLELMTDILYNPTFPEEELEKIKKQTISGLASEKDDPQAIAGNVADVLNYGKEHPYGEIQTEEHVENITVQDLKDYYTTYFKPNIAYLAIVGDIDLKEAKQLAEKYFGSWQKGDVPEKNYSLPQPPNSTVVGLVDRPAAVQTVMGLTYPVDLKPGSDDLIKADVMNMILGGNSSSRFFMNIREDKGYTYGAYSNLGEDELVGTYRAVASVRNEVTDSALVEFIYEMERIRDEKVEMKELSLARNVLAGRFIRSLEQPQTIARFAINTQRYGLPEDYYTNYVKKVQAVSPEDVQQMAQKFILPGNMNIIAVGKASDIGDKLKRFGELKYYDVNGNTVKPPSVSELPADLTANQVLNNYIEALGGEDQIKAIEDVQISMKASIPQGDLNIKTMMKKPGKSFTEISMNGMTFQKIVFDGNDGYMMQMGNKMPMDDQMKSDYKIQAMMFPEARYDELGIDYDLVGSEMVEGQEAYVLEVTLPSGNNSRKYYSKESNLLVRESSTMKTQQGEMTQTTDYGAYQEVNGVMFPHMMQIKTGPQNIKAEVTAIEVNAGIADDVFASNQ
ncbi:MAG: insulinase family protein [Candidatus Cyclobacteriaceae bacterium M3_2C_046]